MKITNAILATRIKGSLKISMAHEEENQAQRTAPVEIMQSIAITPMLEFSPDTKLGTSVATRWNNWQSDFEMYLKASRIKIPSVNVPCCCIKLE